MKIFISFILIITQALRLMSSQEDFSSQAFDSRNIDHSIILFIVDILKDNKILLHEQSIHNKVLENLNNNLAKELLSEN